MDVALEMGSGSGASSKRGGSIGDPYSLRNFSQSNRSGVRGPSKNTLKNPITWGVDLCLESTWIVLELEQGVLGLQNPRVTRVLVAQGDN